MAENENAQHQDNQQPQQEAAPEPVFQLQRCYLKDASLEMPHAPEILLQAQQEQPQVDIKFEVSQKTVAEALYDVTVRGTITVKEKQMNSKKRKFKKKLNLCRNLIYQCRRLWIGVHIILLHLCKGNVREYSNQWALPLKITARL